MPAIIDTRSKDLSVMIDIIRIERETEKAIQFTCAGQREHHGKEIQLWFPKAAMKSVGNSYELKGWFKPSDIHSMEMQRRASYFAA